MAAASAAVVALLLLLGVATVRRVHRGGRTLNDHIVAVVAFGTFVVLGAVAWGLLASSLPSWVRAGGTVLLVVAGVAQYGLFHVADRRRDTGRGGWYLLEVASQPAYAFSFWAGLFLVVRATGCTLRGDPVAAFLAGPWLLGPAGLATWGFLWAFRYGPRVNRRAVACLPAGTQPVRIVHLSDLHFAAILPRWRLAALVAQVNDLRPDLVAVTGDLLMPYAEDEHDALVEELARLEAPLVACPGNHDLPVLDRLVDELGRQGQHLLVDRSLALDLGGRNVEVVGVTFAWVGARDRIRRTLVDLPRLEGARARILLVHDPRLFTEVPAGRFDLVLAGHTHGGQLSFEMFGLPWSAMGLCGYPDKGAFTGPAGLLYVHRGNWVIGLPPRMGTAPEVAVLDLVPVDRAPGGPVG